MSVLQIQLFGNLSVRYQNARLNNLNSPRLQSLLAYLLIHMDIPQPRTQLAFLLWPDSTEVQAHTNLRNLFYLLKRALPNSDQILGGDSHTLCCYSGSDVSLDIHEFENSINEALKAEQTENLELARSTLEAVVVLYRGDLFQNCYEDWILSERSRLRQLYIRTLEHLILLQEKQKAYDRAIQSAQQLLRFDPLHEPTYVQLMRLFTLSDDRAGAIQAYHTCYITLYRELQVEPSPATRQFYEQLIAKQWKMVSLNEMTHPESILPQQLVGWQGEWDQILSAWSTARKGNSHVVLLTGDNGIGKTRLMEEMLQWGNRQGIVTALASCSFVIHSLAFEPVKHGSVPDRYIHFIKVGWLI
jgi:DNA-binding SARP family transcriptional activator